MDIFLMVLFPISSALIVEIFKLPIIPASLLYFGLPATYLSLQKPVLIRKSLFFSIIFSLTALIIIDYPAFLDQTWFVPNSIFRFLNNAIPIEDAIWMFLWVYFVVVIWEYFLDKDKNKVHFDKNTKYLLLLFGSMLTLFFLLFIFAPSYLQQNYLFLKTGIAFEVVPLIIVLWKFPKLTPKVIVLASYFVIISFLVEHSGLKFNHWYYGGGHYLGSIKFMGKVLPWEEIAFWWCLGASAVISWYEFFFDDKK